MVQIKRPKINPTQLNVYIEPIIDIYGALEEEIFEMVAKRLKTSIDLSQDNVLDWQIDKMNQLRMINKDTISALSKTTGKAEKDIRKVINDIGINTIKSVDYELSDIYDPLAMPSDIDRILETYTRQSFSNLNNLVNQSLIDTTFGRGTVSRMYQRIVEETTAKVLTGIKTTNQAITETIVEWSRQGLDTGFVDKSGRVWSLESYARSLIRSTASTTYNEQRMSRMGEYGVDLVLVSSLSDPRKTCSYCQGKVLSLKPINENNSKYPSVYEFDYQEPAGLRGINCRHQFFPYIEGVNTNNQPQFSKEEMDEGREERQKQRYHERQIRDAKKAKKIAEATGDEVSIARYNKLLRNRQARMRGFIDNSNRTRNYPREQIYS